VDPFYCGTVNGYFITSTRFNAQKFAVIDMDCCKNLRCHQGYTSYLFAVSGNIKFIPQANPTRFLDSGFPDFLLIINKKDIYWNV
jgi:hypothetical protein